MSKQAMQKALESGVGGNTQKTRHDAIAELRAAIDAPEVEPVAWMTHHDEPMLFTHPAEACEYCDDDEDPIPLFTTPPDTEALRKALDDALKDRVALAMDLESVRADAMRWRYSVAIGGNLNMNWCDAYEAWDGDGFFVDIVDAAIALQGEEV